MLSQITPEQADEWVAYGVYLEPFGFEMDWLQTGTLASMVYAALGGKGTGTSPADYIPTDKPDNSVDEFRAVIAAKYGDNSKPSGKRNK
tara:strand:- start:6895 stop:7161 length:267 start_codon:yes stop_codon:yes gene_type:complete